MWDHPEENRRWKFSESQMLTEDNIWTYKMMEKNEKTYIIMKSTICTYKLYY